MNIIEEKGERYVILCDGYKNIKDSEGTGQSVHRQRETDCGFSMLTTRISTRWTMRVLMRLVPLVEDGSGMGRSSARFTVTRTMSQTGAV